MSLTNPTRNVEIYVSSSRVRKLIVSNAGTWGELRNEIVRTTNIPMSDLDSENSKIFEGNQRVELVDPSTQLPTNIRLEGGATTNDLLIVVTPKQKVKSGVTRPRPEIYQEIRNLIDHHGETARNHFAGYTNISSDVLENSIVNFKRGLQSATLTPVGPATSNSVDYRAVSAQSIAMVSAALNLLAQAMELIEQSGVTDAVSIQVDPNISRLQQIADSLTR